ncbi:MAG: ATP-binding cassette domain-containing protein [Actinomycetota bacterium]
MTTSVREPATDAAIVAEGLVKRFGDVEAVRGVSFRVAEGKVLGLLGPNGAGKTTVVRMLTTLSRPDAGTARVLGLDVRERPQDVRAMIGLAGQYAAVDENLTGRENLRLVGRLSHLSRTAIAPRVDALLERFDLTAAANRVARTYSGGMRRRLDLAAALVHEPPVLFLDEPTTGLDPQGRNGLWAVIEDLVAGGTTVLLTTQYLEEADCLADDIVVIDHGAVIAQGTATELKAGLGATVIEVGFRDDADAGAAVTRLAAVGAVERDGKHVHLSVPGDDGPGSLLRAVRVLDDAGMEPATLMLHEPTLDDVFLSLTGHTAQDDREAEPDPGAASDDAGDDGRAGRRQTRTRRRTR